MIQRENGDAIGGSFFHCLVDRHSRKTVTALVRTTTARVIHENSAHDLRRYAEEMRAIPPVAVPLVDETQVKLVNERRRLQREPTPFGTKLACGNATQLRVDERQQLVERIGITTPHSVRSAVTSGRDAMRIPKSLRSRRLA